MTDLLSAVREALGDAIRADYNSVWASADEIQPLTVAQILAIGAVLAPRIAAAIETTMLETWGYEPSDAPEILRVALAAFTRETAGGSA